MIPTLYRPDDAVRIPAPVFDLVDDLVGAVPTWRLDDDPLFWELVRDGLAPVDVAAAALEVVPWLLERLVDDPVVEPRVQLHSTEVAAAPVILEPVVEDAPVTASLQLVPPLEVEPVRSVEDEPVTREACPDCGATGLDPCRPKNRPTGTPLPRWHTRRRRLADTGAGTGVVLLVVAVVAVLVAMFAGWLTAAFAPLEQELRPCPVPTAASCPDGPGGAR